MSLVWVGVEVPCSFTPLHVTSPRPAWPALLGRTPRLIRREIVSCLRIGRPLLGHHSVVVETRQVFLRLLDPRSLSPGTSTELQIRQARGTDRGRTWDNACPPLPPPPSLLILWGCPWKPLAHRPLRRRRSLEGHVGPISSLSWSAEGFLLSGSWDETARAWDVDTGSCKWVLGGHEVSAGCGAGIRLLVSVSWSGAWPLRS